MLTDLLRRLQIKRKRPCRPTSAQAAERTGLKLEPDTYCDYAFSLLRTMEAYALPVMVGERFLGFFTRTDALKCAGRDFRSTYIGTVMVAASECGSIPANSDVEYARRKLHSSPYSMLPVVDANNRLLGFVCEESIDRLIDEFACLGKNFV